MSSFPLGSECSFASCLRLGVATVTVGWLCRLCSDEERHESVNGVDALPPRIPSQVEDQADRTRPDERRSEGGVRGQVDRGDAREHAEEAGDQPDRPHGHSEAAEASRGLVVLARVSSPNSRASGASPPTRRSPRLRKRASLAGSNCAPSRWNLTAHSQPTSTMMTCSSGTASPRTELWPMGWPRW